MTTRLEHIGSASAYSIFPLTNPPIDWTSGNWNTYKLNLTQEEPGLHTTNVDEVTYPTWLVFQGTSFPSSMSDYKAVWSYDSKSQLSRIEAAIAALTSPIVYSPSYSGTWFTSQAEMEREFSVAGVSNRTNDFSGGDVTTLMNEIIVQATYESKAVLNQLFEDVDLAAHPWVRRRSTLIACYLLSIRRGNDSEYYNQYLDAIADFQDLIDGRYNIGLAVTGGCRAAMINVATDNRLSFAPIRVDTVSSTSSTQGVNFPKYYTPYVWM